MRPNVAGQHIGAQMTTAADGTPFTATVTVKVTKDGGTQSAGAGSVTHKGGGFHDYAPTQAETNATHLAFTFEGTGAITTTVQVYTNAPQTGDAFAAVMSDLPIVIENTSPPVLPTRVISRTR